MSKIIIFICTLFLSFCTLADPVSSVNDSGKIAVVEDNISASDIVMAAVRNGEALLNSAMNGNSTIANSTHSSVSNLRNILDTILKSLPGTVVLLIVSVLISTLTFFADLRRSNISGKGSSRYLALWIFGNYSFALVLLILILPEGTSLSSPDRTLLLYCIIASGLPEFSAYMKIQLGDSKNAVDFYRFREKFTQFVAEKIASDEDIYERKIFQLLRFEFDEEPEHLNDKLITFTNVCDFSDNEKTEILACLPSANENRVDKSVEGLMTLNPVIKNKLFNFFREDIRRSRASLAAKLVQNLYPPVSAQQARNLVRNGVISPMRFFLRTVGKSQRNKLSGTTNITSDSLALIHNELRGVYREKFKRYVYGTILLIGFLIVSSFILGKQVEISDKNNYEIIIPEEEVALPELPAG